MEFIPLEKYSRKKNKNENASENRETGKSKKFKQDETSTGIIFKNKEQLQTKVFGKKNVKNKYRETLALKRGGKILKKKSQKEKENEDNKLEKKAEAKKEVMEVDISKNEVCEEVQDKEEKNDDEEAFKRKCQKMDEKKKNRLFLKLKKKIHSEAQIKELHPDIRGVIFPRKKNSRWCWAVFASEERADEAMRKLIKNKDVLVSKPTSYDKVDKKRKEKMKTVLRRKEAKTKLQKMWM